METTLTRLGKLEGEPVDDVDYEMYKERAKHLQSVLEEKRATVQLLASQMTKLEGEHRLLIKNLSTRQTQYENLVCETIFIVKKLNDGSRITTHTLIEIVSLIYYNDILTPVARSFERLDGGDGWSVDRRTNTSKVRKGTTC